MGMFSCREVMRIFGRTPPADDLRGGATPVATDPRRPRDERRRRCTWSLATPFFAARVRVTRTHWRSARGRARTGAGRPRSGGGGTATRAVSARLLDLLAPCADGAEQTA